ncbi:MAG: acyltransferase family protein [Corynebacterium sp.]|uniref:acyltransferase family protein n=1 Tax=Corynebacterium sp. TaxID=1720 RepID=UPI0026DCE39B|nr:acyltransferase family protein [Corynebacterium sp.]MDO4761459.1 acyltransferase family protein [Corynebacterium sp.]
MPTPQTMTKQRMAWPDVARGISILGVMILHATMEIPGGLDTPLARVNDFIASLRMPLFFMVSGFFAVKVFGFSFKDLLLRRLWFLAVPYVLWNPIEVLVASVRNMVIGGASMPGAQFVFEAMYTAQNMYWFLYLLVLFTAILWLTKWLPQWVRVLIPVVVIVLTPWIIQVPILVMPRILAYLPPFLLGAYLRDWIAQFAQQANRFPVVAVSLVLAAVSFWLHAQDFGYTYKPVRDVVVSLIYLPCAIVCAVLLAKVPLVGAGVQKVGRNTLVVYLGHPLGLSVGLVLMHWAGLLQWDQPMVLVAMALGFCVAGSVVMFAVGKSRVLGWSIYPPAIAQYFSSPRLVEVESRS